MKTFAVVVFGMLLGDTIILDSLDDANAYRQEVVFLFLASLFMVLTVIIYPFHHVKLCACLVELLLQVQDAISLRFRSSFFNTKFLSLGDPVPLKCFSEMVPKYAKKKNLTNSW